MHKSGFISIVVAFVISLIMTGFAFGQDKNHVVKSGETLSGIAKKYNTSVKELIRLNPEAAKGLKAGGNLTLPGKGEVKESPKTQASSDAEEKTSGTTHTVKSGESLSKIARRYKVQVKDLENWNGITARELKAGQEIRVSAPSGEEPVKNTPKQDEKEEAEKEGFAIHKVTKGETLSAIARKAGTTVAELKKLNGLTNSRVDLDQELKIPAPRELTSATRPAEKILKPEPKPVPVNPPAPEKSQAVVKEPSVVQAPVTEKQASLPEASATQAEIPMKEPERASAGIREINNTLGYTRVVETGFAEAIEGDVNSKKHLCLHKTAPVGSILQVKNEVNGQSVFVKVIGKLPETGSNEKLIIRVSRQAYDKLLAVGKRFPVEVSYPEAQAQ